jgi:hypothetical protein
MTASYSNPEEFSQNYYECREKGLYMTAKSPSEASWDPTKEDDYDATTLAYEWKSGTFQTECEDNVIRSCENLAEGVIDPKIFYVDGATYAEVDCKKEDFFGTAFYQSAAPNCQYNGPNYYTKGDWTAEDACKARTVDFEKLDDDDYEVSCFSDEECKTSIDCVTTTEGTTTTTTTDEAGKPCYEERTKSAAGCLNQLEENAALDHCSKEASNAHKSLFYSKCGQYVPGAPNINSGSTVMASFVMVASLVGAALY